MFASHPVTSAQTNMSERNGTFVCLRINIHVCSEKNDQRSLDLLMILAICRPGLRYEKIETISDKFLQISSGELSKQCKDVFAKLLKRIWKVNLSESLFQNRELSIFQGNPI